MTVKLAKFFNGGGGATPPPLPPPNPPPHQHSYYQGGNLQQQQLHQQQQLPQQHKPYNPYLNDDDDEDDDNMSMYSATASSIMNARGHPFNNSQRPLLAERKPQLLYQNKKKQQQQQQQPKSTTIHALQQKVPQLQHFQQQQQQQQKSYISPYVQQQKRDSAKGLHGFNDFDILSQQYNKHLQSPHIGYPYGSPPSPTAQSSDFVFETLTATKQQQQQQQHLQQHQQYQPQLQQQQRQNNFASMPRYGNISAVDMPPVAVAASAYHSNDINEADYYANATMVHNNQVNSNSSNSGSSSSSTPAMLVTGANGSCMGKPSRFEDDFCCRRNVEFTRHPHHHQQQQQQQQQSGIDVLQTPTPIVANSADERLGGPFIFGVPPEQQSDRVRTPAGGRGFDDSNGEEDYSVINAAGVTEKYAVHNGQATMQSTSDTSSSSRDSNGNNKGAKFLLRKRKSKKNTKDKQSKSNAEKTTKTKGGAEAAPKKPTIKCVVVGDGAVGKTNLILSYLENRFNPEHVPTASDIYNADVMVNDSPVHLTLCDTAGQDTLDPLRELSYPDSDVFLLCFSVARPETFHAIKTKWAPKFHTKTKAALILVGTQADLRTNPNVLNKLQSNGEKPISYADAWDLATTIGAKYIETSSATQDKVKEVFDTAIWEGLVPTTLPPTPPLWKKLLCLA